MITMLVTFCNTLVTNLMMHLYLKPRLHWLTAIPLFTTIIFMFMAIIKSIGWLRFMTIWFTIQKMYSKIYSILSANTHHVSIFGGTHTNSRVLKYVWAQHCVPQRLYFQTLSILRKVTFVRIHADWNSDVIDCLFWELFLITHATVFEVIFPIFAVYDQLISDSRPA